MRPPASATDRTTSSDEPAPVSRTQATSCPSDRSAVTTSPGTFSFASRRAMSDRERVNPLPLQRLGGVVERGLDVLRGQLRIVAEDLLGGPALGQQIDEELDRQPGALDDRLADQDSRVDHDPF